MGPLIRIRTEAGEEALELDEFERRVKRGEVAAHCPVNLPALTGERWVRADELDLFRRLHRGGRHLYFSRAFNLGRFPRMTMVLVLANVAVFAAMSLRGPIDQDALIGWGAKTAPLIVDLGQLWRLLTANLLHENWLHIAFNLFVLFNVGGALENAYRPVDYLWLLVASALGTTLVSLWALPDAVTAGASGMVYGALGAAVVFGIKYRELLPPRYRRVLGEATIPTVLVFLYIGFTSSGVDNWAHLGGLLTGALLALFLKPRLLVQSSPSWRSTLLRLSPIAAIGVALWLGGLAIAGQTELEPVRDDDFGMEAGVPRGWNRGADRFGQIAFHNGLPGVGRASFSAQAQLATEGRPEAALDAYVERALRPEERAGLITELMLTAPRAVELGGLQGLEMQGRYREEDRGARLRAFFLKRGAAVYELVFEWPEEYGGYEAVVERMVAEVRFVEPRSLREARGRVLASPAVASLIGLGTVLDEFGERGGARAAYEQAVERGGGVEARAKLALALIAEGRLDEGCVAVEHAMADAPGSAAVLEAASACRLGRGDKAGAIVFLRDAVQAAPKDERLAEKLRELKGPPAEP